MSWYDKADEQMDERSKEEADREDQQRWDPAPGEDLLGVLTKVKVTPDTMGYGPGLLLIVKDMRKEKDGGGALLWEVWASATVLKSELFDQAPKQGKGIMIRFDGLAQGQSGREYKKFFVEVERDENDIAFTDRELWRDIEAQMTAEAAETADAPKVAQDWGPGEAPF